MEISPEVRQEILKKLTFGGKKPPSARTCKSKLQFAAGVLNTIAKSITRESAILAHSVVSSIQIYLDHTEFLALDKLILKITNKVFMPELFELIRNHSDPEIVAGMCYVKYKHLSVLDTKILDVFPLLKGDIRMKIERVFGHVLSCETGNLSDGAAGKGVRTREVIGQASWGHKYCENGAAGNSVFRDMIGEDRVWNNFSRYSSNLARVSNDKDTCSSISQSIRMIEEDRIKDAKAKLLFVNKRVTGPLKLVVYSLLSYIHFVSLEFQESIFYVDLCLCCSSGLDYEFALDCKFLIERTAMIPSITPQLCYRFDHSIDPGRYQEHFENKVLMRAVLGKSLERISLYSGTYLEKHKLQELLRKAQDKLPEYSILYIFSLDDDLYVSDLTHMINVDWSESRIRLDQVMAENRSILSVKPITTEDKQHWWTTRIRLDRELEGLLADLKARIGIETRSRILLVLEESIVDFPFEALFGKPALRMLSQDFFRNVQTSRIESRFYLLDPANDLPSTRETISGYISRGSCRSVCGVVGRPLSEEECKCLENKDLFMYFGHGTGKRYFEIRGRDPGVLFLFGCSSCRLVTVRNFKCNGFSLRHIRRRVVLGNIWDVTDKDLDKMTVAILEDVFHGKSLAESVHRNRQVCKLKYLNSGALVIYGGEDITSVQEAGSA